MIAIRRLVPLAATMLVALGTLTLKAQDPGNPAHEAEVGTARGFVAALMSQDFAGARKDFDEKMSQALSQEVVGQILEQLTATVGSFERVIKTRSEEKQGRVIVHVVCQFARGPLDLVLAIDATSRKIAGLRIAKVEEVHPYQAPAYVDSSTFDERDATVGTGEWACPGTLSMPKGEGPFPAVVLVHGSGPQDRDETVGPIKVFRDLAWGLASHGIAVLRYEKRTHCHGPRFASIIDTFTVKEEVTDDALAGVAFLRSTTGIDPSRVYLLGHSLGAYLAPRMGTLDPRIAGLILLAGPARHLEDVIVEQAHYLAALKDTPEDEAKKAFDDLEAKAAQVKDPKLDPKTPARELLLGLPAPYWIDLQTYDPVAVAKDLKQPMLILQGERDYQVTLEDFKLWKDALGSRSNVTLKTYPKLCHLFTPGEGTPSPKDYDVAGHVPEETIRDLVIFVK